MTREPSAQLPDATIRAAITKDLPAGTADALWFDVSDRLDATSQRRRRLFAFESPGMRVALAAIVVIAVMGGAVYFLGPTTGVGVPPPTAQPTATPTSTPEASPARSEATVPTDWTSYTSNRLGYTADYPADWPMTPAKYDWPTIGLPEKGGPNMDVVGPNASGDHLWVASVPLKPGKDAAYWVAQLDSQNAAFCNSTSNRHSITLDGVNARQEDQVCAQYHPSHRGARSEQQPLLRDHHSSGRRGPARGRGTGDV